MTTAMRRRSSLRTYSTIEPMVEMQITRQVANRLFNMTASNFMAVFLEGGYRRGWASQFAAGLQDHRTDGGDADHQAGAEQAVQHEGFKFHGGTPGRFGGKFTGDMARPVPTGAMAAKAHSHAVCAF